MSEALTIELIKAAGFILAALVPSVAALAINRAKRSRVALESDLKKALGDIRFLLAVEAEYGRNQKEETGQSHVRKIRKIVHAQHHLNWSGAFSDKRAQDRLSKLN